MIPNIDVFRHGIPLPLLVCYFEVFTSSWLLIFALPAADWASSAIFAFSVLFLTGPRSVTSPLAVIIFTFFAVAESESSPTTALRMIAVIFTYSWQFDNPRKYRWAFKINASSGDQSNSQEDVKITAAIRRAVVGDHSLSATAKNVKIITANGLVTLRGPVKNDAEKAKIAELAQSAAGNAKINNQLEVKTSK